MMRWWLIGFMMGIGSLTLFAQPKPCGANPKMTTFCQDACIICDIDGFKGRHDSKVSGSLPRGFCTTTVHNSQWIAFIAGSTDLQIQLTVSNCVQGDGLEMTIYESRDCSTFVQVFNCDGEVRPGSTMTFTNNRPLIIGQYYYLAMDGNNGDNCDWSLKVTKGTTKVPPLSTSGLVEGPRVTCPNVPVSFEVIVPSGATEFGWKVNGLPVGKNDSILEYVFPRPGIYTLCMQAANVCDTAPETCFSVVVKTIPPTDLNVTLCPGECYAIAGDLLCATGFHEVHIPLSSGCDSIVRINLIIEQPQEQRLKVNICSGDTLRIGTQNLTTSGLHTVHLSTTAGCDSVVIVDLLVVECDIQADGQSAAVRCHSGGDGIITFMVKVGTPSFTYRLSNGIDTMLRAGDIRTLNEEIALIGLRAGIYFVEIFDRFGNREILIITLEEPDALMATVVASAYHGFGLSCHQNLSGSLSTMVWGGSWPYSYLWSNGARKAALIGLSAGNYTVTISDAQGCTISLNQALTEPDALNLIVTATAPDCSDLRSGALAVTSTTGGVADYIYSLDGQTWQKGVKFSSLMAGPYQVHVRDINGCLSVVSDTIPSIIIPEISFAGPLTLDLGQQVTIEPRYTPFNGLTYQWTPVEFLDCGVCPFPSVMPLRSAFYTVRVTSVDGCKTADSVFIQVIKKRYVYMPNAFHPGGSSNPVFRIHSGPGVVSIESLQVFDRWGNLVYAEQNNPADLHAGWDGTIKQTPASAGVYTWVARIRFIDNEVEQFAGDVTLWR